MLEHMKKPHINKYAEILFQIPYDQLREFMETFASFGANEAQDQTKIRLLIEERWIPFKKFFESGFGKSPHMDEKNVFKKMLSSRANALRNAVQKAVAPCELPENEVDKFIMGIIPCELQTKTLERFIKNIIIFCSAKKAEESVPWEEVYPNFNPSVALRGARKKEGLTQEELAQLLGISQNHISEMENGKRTIGKAMAKRLSNILKIDYRVFL